MQDETNPELLVETIPDELFALWKQLPLRLATRKTLPVVELRDGILTLRWCHDVITAHVQDCHFRVGRPWRMKHNARSARRCIAFGEHDLILIDFPPLYRGFFSGKTHSYNTAPVGYTQRSLQTWKRALAPFIGESQESVKQFLGSPCGFP